MSYPEHIAKEWSEATRKAYNEQVARNKKAKRIIHEDSSYDALGYKTSDGKIRMCYSPYEPTCPSDAIAGVVHVKSLARYYPNATRGYEYICTNFRTFDEYYS